MQRWQVLVKLHRFGRRWVSANPRRAAAAERKELAWYLSNSIRFSITDGGTTSKCEKTALASAVFSHFEVVPPSVIENRIEFDKYQANSFLSAAAARLGLAETQRLPKRCNFTSTCHRCINIFFRGDCVLANAEAGDGIK